MASPRSLSAIKPVIMLLAGNLLGAFVGGAFFLLASWNFDLAEMGRYTVAISIQWVVVGLLGSGLSTATVRLSAEQFKHGRLEAAADIVHGALGILVLAGTAAVAVLVLIDAALAGKGYLSGNFLALIVAWAVTRAMLDVTRAALLAQQRYAGAARVTILSALTGACALIVTVQLGELTLGRLLAAHVVGLGSAALLGGWFLRDLGAPGWSRMRAAWPDLLRYARWPASSEGTRLLQANLGPLLLVPLAGSGAAGLFGVARYPAYLFEVVAVSLYQYWLPEASREGRQGNIRGYLKAQLMLAAAIGLAMVLGAAVVSPFLPRLGENFAAAAPLFLLNAVDFAIFLMTRPIESVFHGLGKPHLELWPRLIRIPMLVVAALLLVPSAGALGMVWAHVITGVIALLFAGWLVWRAMERLEAALG